MPKLLPDGPGAARAIRLAYAATDVLGAVLCAVVTRWTIPFAGVSAVAIVAVVAVIGWLIWTRRWAIAYVTTTTVLAVIALF